MDAIVVVLADKAVWDINKVLPCRQEKRLILLNQELAVKSFPAPRSRCAS